MQFENLPQEVLNQVLCSLDSPRALLSAIRASPSCFLAFRKQQLPIISAVLGKFTTPEVLAHAVAAVLAPGIRSTPERPDVQETFLPRYFGGDEYVKRVFFLDECNMMAVLRLTAQVEWLVDDYVQFTMRETNTGPDVQEPERFWHQINELSQIHPMAVERCARFPGFPAYILQQISNVKCELDIWHQYQSHMSERNASGVISETERSRLLRSFFMFIVYTEWFGPENPNSPHASESTEAQYETFLAELLGWELEQLVCLHDYFKARLVGIFDDIENEIMEKLERAAREQRTNRAAVSLADTTVLGDELCYEGGPLPFVSEESRELADAQIAPLTMLGVGFLYTLFRAPPRIRKDLIRAKGQAIRGDYLSTAIQSCGTLPRDGAIDMEGCEDHLLLQFANNSYFRQPDFEAYMDIWRDDSKKGLSLRKRGFIFRDMPRDMQQNISSNCTTEVGEEFMFQPPPLKRNNAQSAQQRFGGIRVPFEAARQIFDEYAWLVEPCPAWYGEEEE